MYYQNFCRTFQIDFFDVYQTCSLVYICKQFQAVQYFVLYLWWMLLVLLSISVSDFSHYLVLEKGSILESDFSAFPQMISIVEITFLSRFLFIWVVLWCSSNGLVFNDSIFLLNNNKNCSFMFSVCGSCDGIFLSAIVAVLSGVIAWSVPVLS